MVPQIILPERRECIFFSIIYVDIIIFDGLHLSSVVHAFFTFFLLFFEEKLTKICFQLLAYNLRELNCRDFD